MLVIISEMWDINGINYRLNVAGAGETMVLLHGGHTNLDIWEDQIAYFVQHYRVIAYDQRGYGHTDTPSKPFSYEEDLRNILNHFDVDKAILVGASFGGSVAIDFTLKYPDQVKALVLAGPAVSGKKIPFRMNVESMKNYITAKKKGIHTAAAKFEQNRYWSYFIPKQSDKRQKFMDIYKANKAFYTWNMNLAKKLQPPASSRLSEIQVPTLIIEPVDDLPFNKTTCKMLEKSIKNSILIQLHDTGHLPNLEQPAKFNEAVYSWLQRL